MTELSEPYNEEPGNRNDPTLYGLEQVDIVPTVEHVSFEDEGYEVTHLARGKHFDINLKECDAIEAEENMRQSGFKVRAQAIATIRLADFPIILFDRGADKDGIEEDVIDLPPSKQNITVSKRFFLLSEEGFARIGLSFGSQVGCRELNGFTPFNPGEKIYLGRQYEELFNSEYNTKVSNKHAVVEANHEVIRITDCHSLNGTVIEKIPKLDS